MRGPLRVVGAVTVSVGLVCAAMSGDAAQASEAVPCEVPAEAPPLSLLTGLARIAAPVPRGVPGAELYYAPAGAERIEPVRQQDGTTHLVRVPLGGPTAGIATIGFNPGPSYDPIWSVWWGDDLDREPALTVCADRLIVPGNGELYADGHANAMFHKRRLYRVGSDGHISEVEQPFDYVGLKGVVEHNLRPGVPAEEIMRPVSLRATPERTGAIVATLQVGDPIEVLIASGDWYLVVTEFGLTGWVEVEYEASRSQIGVYFFGDG